MRITVIYAFVFSHWQGSKRVVMVDSLNRFSEFIETSELNLPSSTVAFEEEGKVVGKLCVTVIYMYLYYNII